MMQFIDTVNGLPVHVVPLPEKPVLQTQERDCPLVKHDALGLQLFSPHRSKIVNTSNIKKIINLFIIYIRERLGIMARVLYIIIRGRIGITVWVFVLIKTEIKYTQWVCMKG